MWFLFLLLMQDSQFTFEQWSSVDAIEFVAGYGEDTRHFRMALHWDIYERQFNHFKAETTLALNYAAFDNPDQVDRASQLRDLGVTPVVKLIPNRWWGPLQPFAEFGIGLHYLTERDVGPKTFSTNFQFGDHIGFGFNFGKRVQTTIAYQFQHFSNGGIDAPNPGINFHILSMGLKFPH
ncbi:MAG: acyloxyacyl hydrolase [Acidobacteria bacterium]|nr:acyloxyacyl hydrolase [Acidobacteriota bacterium]